MYIGWHLGKTVPEMRAMNFKEFMYWRAFIKVQEELKEIGRRRARPRSK